MENTFVAPATELIFFATSLAESFAEMSTVRVFPLPTIVMSSASSVKFVAEV